MVFIHRLVIVIGFFGACYMWLMLRQFTGEPGQLLLMAGPGLVAAGILYPIAWVFSGIKS